MKVLFLDVDGVLNCIGVRNRTIIRTPDGYIGIDPAKVTMLKKIIDTTGAKIVVSSFWRVKEDSLSWLEEELNKQGMSSIGKTEQLNRFRGLEIQKWLDDHANDHIESFVILDDDNDMCHLQAQFVHIDFNLGLTDADVEKAISILNMVSVV